MIFPNDQYCFDSRISKTILRVISSNELIGILKMFYPSCNENKKKTKIRVLTINTVIIRMQPLPSRSSEHQSARTAYSAVLRRQNQSKANQCELSTRRSTLGSRRYKEHTRSSFASTATVAAQLWRREKAVGAPYKK